MFGIVFCTSFQAMAQQEVTISGKITNPASDSILISYPENPLEARKHVAYAPLNDNGEFRLTLPLKQPVLADLESGGEGDGITLYLQPGDNLDVKFNARDVVKTIKFKGKGEAENTYLREQEYEYEEDDGWQVLPDNIYLGEEKFARFLDNRKKSQEKFLERYLAKHPISETFELYAKAQIEFTWANDRLTYPDLREQIVINEKRLALAPSYYNFLEQLNLNNPAAFISPVYNEFVNNYLEHLAAAANVKRTSEEYYYTLFNLAKTKLQGEARNLAQGQILLESCRQGHIGFTERMLADWSQRNTNPVFAAAVSKAYEANKRFAMGALAPDFKAVTFNGDTLQLSDLKGKLVYVSFWQTECGLCLMDMPHGQELAKNMEGKDIVFLQIGMDKDEKTWRNMVAKKKLLGTHVYGKSFGQDLAALYGIKEAPAYFLIGEDGTFLTTKPKRPSSHGIAEEINRSFGKAANTASILKNNTNGNH